MSGIPRPGVDLSGMSPEVAESLARVMDDVGVPLYMVTVGTAGVSARPTPFLDSMLDGAPDEDTRVRAVAFVARGVRAAADGLAGLRDHEAGLVEVCAAALVREQSGGLHIYHSPGHPDRDDTDRYAEAHARAVLAAGEAYVRGRGDVDGE